VNSPRRLVLDANILLRAVFGVRARGILELFEDVAAFYSPGRLSQMEKPTFQWAFPFLVCPRGEA